MSPFRVAIVVFIICSAIFSTDQAFGQAQAQAQTQAQPKQQWTQPKAQEQQTWQQSQKDVWKAQATAANDGESFGRALMEVKRLHAEKPNSAKLRMAQRKALALAEQIGNNLDAQVKQTETNSSLTAEQKANLKNTAEEIKKWMRGEMDSALIPIRGVIMKDPNAPASEKNIAQVELQVAGADRETLMKEAQEHKRSLISRGATAGGHFTTQYATFGAASFLLATAQLGMSYQTNPVALDQWLMSVKDPVGAAGFALFMAVNHPVSAALMGVMKGTIPRLMIPYIGMLAGSLASTAFHDVVADADLHKCTMSYFTKAGRSEEICNKAFDTWVPTNKIIEYSPGLMSLIASQAIADVGRYALVRAFGQGTRQALAETAPGKAVRLVFNGLKVVPQATGVAANAARSGATVAAGGFTPVSFALGAAQFTVFLAIDSVVAEPIMQWKSEAMLASMNLKTFFDKWGFHREFSRPVEGKTQMIQNAFDVEATDLYSAHQYLMLSYTNLGQSAWAKPEDVNKCVPPEVAEKKIPGILSRPVMLIPNIFDSFAKTYRLIAHSKSDQQLRCEVLARPTELITRYGELNKKWRETLLTSFTTKQQSWLQLIANFNEVFLASNTVAQYLADAKHKMSRGGEKPDLSREAISKLIVDPDAQAQAAAGGGHSHAQPSQPNSFGRLATPQLADYVIATLACGTNVSTAQAEESSSILSRAWSKAVTFVKGRDTAYLKTRFGSSFQFVAPNITTGDGSICSNGEWTQDPNYTLYSNEVDALPADVFTGKFRDSATKRTYVGLAEYVFENIKPEVYQAEGDYSNFAVWWDKNVQESIEPVWQKYAKAYGKLIEESFLPVAFNREFRNGCPTVSGRGSTNNAKAEKDSDGFVAQTSRSSGKGNTDQNCADSPIAYRVGQGVFLSLEIEMRNYLRGVYSIYASTFSQTDKEMQKHALKAYLDVANHLISRVVNLGKEEFKSDELPQFVDTNRDAVSALKAMVEAKMDEIGEPEDSFRRASLNQLTTAINNLLFEQGQYAAKVKTMDFMDAISRPLDEKVNTPKPSNPFNRGPR